jgi:hypothetical protein
METGTEQKFESKHEKVFLLIILLHILISQQSKRYDFSIDETSPSWYPLTMNLVLEKSNGIAQSKVLSGLEVSFKDVF